MCPVLSSVLYLCIANICIVCCQQYVSSSKQCFVFVYCKYLYSLLSAIIMCPVPSSVLCLCIENICTVLLSEFSVQFSEHTSGAGLHHAKTELIYHHYLYMYAFTFITFSN